MMLVHAQIFKYIDIFSDIGRGYVYFIGLKGNENEKKKKPEFKRGRSHYRKYDNTGGNTGIIIWENMR